MPFLPNDYREPNNSPYMKLEDGENTFRVLDSAVIGWEYWVEEKDENGELKNKPHRVAEEKDVPYDKVVINKYGSPNVNFFWAFPVYNFKLQKIQLLQITQKSVREDMYSFIKNTKWGDPTEYNFVVTRSKNQAGKVSYSVIAEPKEPLDKAITKLFSESNYSGQRWFEGGHPFREQGTTEGVTDSVSQVEDMQTEVDESK